MPSRPPSLKLRREKKVQSPKRTQADAGFLNRISPVRESIVCDLFPQPRHILKGCLSEIHDPFARSGFTCLPALKPIQFILGIRTPVTLLASA